MERTNEQHESGKSIRDKKINTACEDVRSRTEGVDSISERRKIADKAIQDARERNDYFSEKMWAKERERCDLEERLHALNIELKDAE